MRSLSVFAFVALALMVLAWGAVDDDDASDGEVLFSGDAADAEDAWNDGGVGHPEFQVDGGRVEYVTCFRPGGDLDGEMRLVRVEFH